MIERLPRVQQQRAALTRRLAERDRARGRHAFADRLEQKACEEEVDAKVIGQMLIDRSCPESHDTAE